MYSKKLEEMISMALVDGAMDESDRQVINKVAVAEGVDLDELQWYINSLAKKQRNEHAKSVAEESAKYERETREAIGNICPNPKCHKQIPPMSLECPHCHTKIVNKKATSSVRELADKIEKIQSKYRFPLDAQNQRIMDAINLFPVPNTKEDIIEFLALSAPNAKTKGGLFGTLTKRLIFWGILLLLIIIVTYILCINGSRDARKHVVVVILDILFLGGGIVYYLTFIFDKETLRWNKRANVWRTKFDQVLMKGRSMQGDSEFQSQLDYYERVVYKS